MNTAAFIGRLTGDVDLNLLAEMKAWTDQVEAVLRTEVGSQVPMVEEIGRLTLEAGGKRLRPALVRLSAAASGRPYDPDRAIRLGCAMEMIHMATLIHDDVIDDAGTRRGAPTAFSRFGSTASILGGDVLLAKAMSLLAIDGDLAIIRMVSRAVVELAEGEVEELALRGRLDISAEQYERIIRMKTAGFIECCCRVGALLARADESTEEALAQYGHGLGMAFQIVDDVLDYRGDSAMTGKPVAGDFREGQPTLPLLYLLAELTESERGEVTEHFGTESSVDAIDNVQRALRNHGSLTRAYQKACEFATTATRALDPLPDSHERRLLTGVAQFVLNRES